MSIPKNPIFRGGSLKETPLEMLRSLWLSGDMEPSSLVWIGDTVTLCVRGKEIPTLVDKLNIGWHLGDRESQVISLVPY
jgi:hypothetical protein